MAQCVGVSRCAEEVPQNGQMQKVSSIIGRGLDSPSIRCSRPSQMPRRLETGESPKSDKCPLSAKMALGVSPVRC